VPSHKQLATALTSPGQNYLEEYDNSYSPVQILGGAQCLHAMAGLRNAEHVNAI